MRPYLAMRPRLDAERQLAAVNAAGFPHMKKEADRRRYVKRLERVAEPGRRRARRASKADLAAMGITVEQAD